MKKNLKIGDKASLVKVFTQEEVVNYAQLSGDVNPIHLDESYAAGTVFGKRIVHGMLVASLFSALVGVELPGEGSIYLGQSLSFKAPVFIGDRVTATVEIIKIREDKPIITLRSLCVNDAGQTLIEGEAVVKYV
ncbi:MAG: MaoC family dehydratase [Candidatus Nitrohelix vancouverensis]|uniref:MaoC family dehydratase n=1 Tax=Candidatus Nitrohelix vancouverensis TaxID=2705534 RepID=A0A7T0C0B3_9BACT|nr:MAG: MaoC family dehydratase [Candidatus Nitrohelix vancouverensis]